MGTLVSGTLALGALLAAGGICRAQFFAAAASGQGNVQVTKQEPFDGQMSPGSVLLVDDGSCGKGRIKQVIGGEIGAMNPRPRIRTCIPKVTK